MYLRINHGLRNEKLWTKRAFRNLSHFPFNEGGGRLKLYLRIYRNICRDFFLFTEKHYTNIVTYISECKHQIWMMIF